MAYLTKDDLVTHLYPEIRDEITRSDDTLIDKAISSGMGEVRSYLNRYDLLAIFGDNATAPTFTDEFLNNLVKDIACWHLIRLANPNINLELFRTSYEDAVKYLDKVMKGIVDPEWPLKADDPDTPIDDAGNVEWSSNTKRNNYY